MPGEHERDAVPGIRCITVLSRLRASAEALAEGLTRFFPLDVLTHGAVAEEIGDSRVRDHEVTVVFDGSSPGELEHLAWAMRSLRTKRAVVFGLGPGLDDLRWCARHQVGGLVACAAPMSELAEAVDAVASGRHYTSASLIPGLMELAAANPIYRADDLARLTDRERQVAEMLGRGLTYAQIAADLAVSPSTVKNHAHNIYRKMREGTSTERVVRGSWRADDARDARDARDAEHARGEHARGERTRGESSRRLLTLRDGQSRQH